MKKDTLFTISERTGFSISTVSRVLSGKGKKYRISQKTIDYIKEVARSCNYTPNLIAQSLRTRKTNTIGLAIPNIDNPFFATMSGVIINHLKKKGYNVLLSDTMESESNENQVIGSFVSRNVDAIIVVPVGSSSSYLESVAETVPVVLIDRYFENTKLPYVCTDNYIGSYMAAEYLIDKGYRNILAIQGVQSSMPNKERVRGFSRAVADHEAQGVKETIIGDSFSVDNGYTQAMAALSLEGSRPDAIFAFSTTILLGVIKAVRDLGLKIPDDVAIISFDNNRFLDFLNPSITRIEQPVNLVGKLVVDCITQLIDGDDEDPSTPLQTLLRPTLIEGKSC